MTYYIYTLEDTQGKIYVGCTIDPYRRLRDHLSGLSTIGRYNLIDYKFFLRYQTTDPKEAQRMESTLAKTAVNRHKNTRIPIYFTEPKRPIKLKSLLKTSFKVLVNPPPPPPQSHRPKINFLGGKTPSVMMSRRWYKFKTVEEAESFINKYTKDNT